MSEKTIEKPQKVKPCETCRDHFEKGSLNVMECLNEKFRNPVDFRPRECSDIRKEYPDCPEHREPEIIEEISRIKLDVKCLDAYTQGNIRTLQESREKLETRFAGIVIWLFVYGGIFLYLFLCLFFKK